MYITYIDGLFCLQIEDMHANNRMIKLLISQSRRACGRVHGEVLQYGRRLNAIGENCDGPVLGLLLLYLFLMGGLRQAIHLSLAGFYKLNTETQRDEKSQSCTNAVLGSMFCTDVKSINKRGDDIPVPGRWLYFSIVFVMTMLSSPLGVPARKSSRSIRPDS